MLYFNFKRIFKLRDIERPYTFLLKQGYSTAYASKVSNSRMWRLDLREVEKLCILFNCTPNDLLAWVPKSKDELPEDHALNTLKRTDNISRLTNMLSSVSIEKLDEIEKVITKIKNEKSNP